MKRVLVTGSAGFIGKNLLRHLDGIVVKSTRGVEFPDGDFDIIVHAAGKHKALDQTIIHDNMIGTLKTLELAKERNVKLFIFLSTIELFGPGSDIKTEDSKYNCPTVYSAAKAGAEQLCIASGLPVAIVRLVNVYGPFMQSWKFIPKCIDSIMNGKPVEIHDGRRSWVHVFDVADAINFIIKNSLSGTFNVTGQEISNIELANAFAKACSRPLFYTYAKGGPGHEQLYPVSGNKLQWKYSREITDPPSFSKILEYNWEADFRTHPPDAPLCGVYIETRVLPENERALRNFSHMLPYASLTIFYSDENESQIRNIINNNSNIRMIKFPIAPFVYREYENYLKSREFWSQFVNFDRVLIFMNDTCIRSNRILDFMKYDYIGCPWDHFPIGDPRIFQGGGAFSIRNPILMLQIIEENPPQEGFPEDVYFSAHTTFKKGTCVPRTREEAARFCTNCLGPEEDPMGFLIWENMRPISYTLYEGFERGPRKLVSLISATKGSQDVTKLIRLGIGPSGFYIPDDMNKDLVLNLKT
jgi:nucleoside-diphosphate-sugar epimerase